MKKFLSVVDEISDNLLAIVMGWLLKFVIVTAAGPAVIIGLIILLHWLEPILGDGNGLQSFDPGGAVIAMLFAIVISWGLWWARWKDKQPHREYYYQDHGREQVPLTCYLVALLITAMTPIGWYKLMKWVAAARRDKRMPLRLATGRRLFFLTDFQPRLW